MISLHQGIIMKNSASLKILQKINHFIFLLDQLIEANDFEDQFIIESDKFKNALYEYQCLTKSRFIKEKMELTPVITQHHINEHLKSKKSGSSQKPMLNALVSLIKELSKDQNQQLNVKIEHWKKDLLSIIHVIEHPGFEEMYYDNKPT